MIVILPKTPVRERISLPCKSLEFNNFKHKTVQPETIVEDSYKVLGVEVLPVVILFVD